MTRNGIVADGLPEVRDGPDLWRGFRLAGEAGDRIRLLIWDQTRMVLIHKRLGGRQIRLVTGAG